MTNTILQLLMSI